MILNRKCASALLVLLYTYINNPFYFAAITPLHKAFYYAAALVPVAFCICRGFKYEQNFGSFSRLFLLYFISIFSAMIASAALDFQYLFYFLRLLIGMFASVSVFCIWSYANHCDYVREDFPIIFLKSVAFYVLGTVAFICVPPLKQFWQSIIVDFGETDFSSFVEYVTRFGFAGFSGFGCAFLVSCAAVLMCYLFLNGKITLKQCKIFSCLFIVGSFFYGRIGFVVSFFVCGIFSVYQMLHHRPKLFCFYILVVAVIIAVGTMLYFAFPDIQPFIDWLLEPVFNFVEKGTFESASTNQLGRMYENFSPSEKTLVFGDGYWLGLDGSGYYGRTDVGFMRNILYGGIFYTGLLYSLVLVFLFILYQALKNCGKKGSGFIIFLMSVQFLLFELKGDITFSFLKVYIPFYLYLMYEKRTASKFDVKYGVC